MADEARPPVSDSPHQNAESKKPDHLKVMKRWQRAYDNAKENIDRAYDALRFSAGDQWPDLQRRQRIEDGGRPVLTFNRIGQYRRQITGDIRKMSLAITVSPNSGGADEDMARIRGGLIRHIEQRSDATDVIYPAVADSAVVSGIGHAEVFTEYSGDGGDEQEIGIRLIDDQVFVLWDPDSKHPSRTDAMFCFIPSDMSREAYEDEYPDHPVSGLGDTESRRGWFAGGSGSDSCDDTIRVARYWYKTKEKYKTIKLPGLGSANASDLSPDELASAIAMGGKLVPRERTAVHWVTMNGAEFLNEPKEWPGPDIPVIPMIGEETRIAGKVIRKGIVHDMKDAQMSYNFARSTETEVVGLQPKAGFIGTEENFRDHEAEWETANVKNWPYLAYKPDARNGGMPPQRSQPPLGSAGVSECIMRAEGDMQAIVGIYNSAIGAKSNETSGVAIRQREQQADTGSFVYLRNFGLFITQVARVINGLLPYVYDTARTARIIGEDGTEGIEDLNQPQGLQIGSEQSKMANDMTVGEYGVTVGIGPAADTQREAARQGMLEFLRAYPQAAPVVGDLYAKALDFPNANQISDRLYKLLPPQIQMEEAQRTKDPSKAPMPPPPDPRAEAAMQAEQAKMQAEVAKAGLSVEREKLLNVKAEFDVLTAQVKLAQTQIPVDPAQLQQWIGNVDTALALIDQHLAGQFSDQTAGAGGPPQPPLPPGDAAGGGPQDQMPGPMPGPMPEAAGGGPPSGL